MFKVFYELPRTFIREIIMDSHELSVWLTLGHLRRRILYYEKID